MSDLSAAYYHRAQREDRPSDFLRALHHADRALASTSPPKAAYFNRALALEALGLVDDAIDAWEKVPQDDTWAEEVRKHHKHLMWKGSQHAANRWAVHHEALRAALSAHDVKAVERLIAPFPLSAQYYFEEQLLPEWIMTPTAGNLEFLRMFATALATRPGGDRFALDTVEAMARTTPSTFVRLREAHRTYN